MTDYPATKFGTFRYPDFTAFDGTAAQWIAFIEQAEIDDETIDRARKAYEEARGKSYLVYLEETDFRFNNDPKVVALIKSRGWDSDLKDRLRKERHDAAKPAFQEKWPHTIPPQYARHVVRWVQAFRLAKVASPTEWDRVDDYSVRLSSERTSTPKLLWERYHSDLWVEAI